MQCARVTAWGLGIGLGVSSMAMAPRTEPLMLRLANLTTARESARVGFAFDLEGPPLVDELAAGALTTLLPARADRSELWVLPRGQTLPKSLPEPLPLPSSGLRPAPLSGAATGAMTVFLIDRPGSRGDFVRKLVTGAPAPAEAAQLRILNLVGTTELDVCLTREAAAPVTRAVPAWGLSRFAQWSQPPAGTETWLTLRAAAEPACHGPKLGAVQLRLAERGAWTLVAMADPTSAPLSGSAIDQCAGPRDGQRDGHCDKAPALRVLLLDEGSLLPEHAVALPVLPDAPSTPHR